MKQILLIILDGWGYSDCYEGNAVRQAKTPNLDSFFVTYPWALLDAAGEAVGLPSGQMGNSEVGHLNMGAGRVVRQELTRISQSITTGEFFQNTVLLKAMANARKNNGALHLVGLVSDGGVHSHLDHLLALLEMAETQQVERVFVHAILDGRDTIPIGARPFLEQLYQRSQKKQSGFVATIIGRYYAMDRDQRWERIKGAYMALARGIGMQQAENPVQALTDAYESGETDEFVRPTVIVNTNGEPLTTVCSEDSMIFFNFRPDRSRQISRAFMDDKFFQFDRGENPPHPYSVTMTEYDRSLPVPVAFTNNDLVATLGEIYSRYGLPQMRIAETEKYGHVTFFFNGGREKPFPGEERILVPSPKVATYDLKPEMSAPELTARLLETIRAEKNSLVVVNYANLDMVGHSGDFNATIRAAEAVDFSLGLVVGEALRRGWFILVCGDHGNTEQMLDEEGFVLTAHTTNPVPLLLLGTNCNKLRKRGILADVAPTILELVGISCPPEMTGKSMIVDDQRSGVSKKSDY